jgi:hypothetical protein
MYVDISEMRSKADLAAEREIGVKPGGEKITSHLGSVIHDYIESSSPFPDDIVEAEIIRISRHTNYQEPVTWFVDTALTVHWTGHRDEIPDFLTSKISGDYEYFVAQPSLKGIASPYYSFTDCEGVGEIMIPSMGKTLGELSEEDLQGLFVEIDIDTFVLLDENSEEMCWNDTFHCINCSELIHVDDDANNCCGRCGCREPSHPAPEDVDFWDLHEEWR